MYDKCDNPEENLEEKFDDKTLERSSFGFHVYISYLNLLRGVALRPKPFSKGPSDKKLITINS